jgi:hypothetical protein
VDGKCSQAGQLKERAKVHIGRHPHVQEFQVVYPQALYCFDDPLPYGPLDAHYSPERSGVYFVGAGDLFETRNPIFDGEVANKFHSDSALQLSPEIQTSLKIQTEPFNDHRMNWFRCGLSADRDLDLTATCEVRKFVFGRRVDAS